MRKKTTRGGAAEKVESKGSKASKAAKGSGKGLPFHAFWSGSLSFGLVNVPVVVFPASRHSGVRLRMLSPGGSFLARRFFCPEDGKDGKEVGWDEIVKGYELEDRSYITVTDEELEAAEPKKTREIELKQFVDLSELPPTLFERGYYLTPAKEATKAYRLLTEVMERTKRAGIATFVMRDREYLVAIFAENGLLCAETLRFEDELRSPEAIGLPAAVKVPRPRVVAFERLIDGLSARELSMSELEDRDTRRLRAIIDKKRRAGKDVVRVGAEGADVELDEEDDPDLLETIRNSLRSVGGGRAAGRRRTAARQEAGSSKTGRKGRASGRRSS